MVYRLVALVYRRGIPRALSHFLNLLKVKGVLAPQKLIQGGASAPLAPPNTAPDSDCNALVGQIEYGLAKIKAKNFFLHRYLFCLV